MPYSSVARNIWTLYNFKSVSFDSGSYYQNFASVPSYMGWTNKPLCPTDPSYPTVGSTRVTSAILHLFVQAATYYTPPSPITVQALLSITLRQIRVIRRSLTKEAAKMLVSSFSCSGIDYCNAVFAGLPSSTTNHLDSVLHAAARMISGRSKYDRIISVLRDELHWLPVPQRVI